MIQLSRIYYVQIRYILGPLSLRQCSNYRTKPYIKTRLMNVENSTDALIKQIAPKIIYNTLIEKKVQKFEREQRKERKTVNETPEPLPVTLKYVLDDINPESESLEAMKKCVNGESTRIVNFPYEQVSFSVETTPKTDSESVSLDVAADADEEVRTRHQLHKEMKNWMVNYDNYDDSCLHEEVTLENNPTVNYGTPDPTAPISNVPCGGCGALLHCKDTAIPGYIPSEIYKNSSLDGGSNLAAVVCQRCHFLKHYNLALQVQVTPDDYPKVLASIKEKAGLVVLMVDLLDFPCSIWPGIGEIFGHRKPLVVVGNKVDLLPQDSERFLQHIKTTLLNYVKLQGFGTFNIKEVALISAKTGFGVEDLITKLGSLGDIKGDVYIVGCTNVGKSSLFNALIQSDYCKTQAIDLIQRATTSVWPGTTLNLLKFPIKRPVGFRQYLREQRLKTMHNILKEEAVLRKEQLRKTRNPKYASLIGHIDVTISPDLREEEPKDLFSQGQKPGSGTLIMGLNEKSKAYKYGKWCYDTPGVVPPDQILHLLTTEELLLTLPKNLVLPRTLCLKPQSTLFIAGLARLDYIEGPNSIRFTIFSSQELPLTVCALEDAQEVYNKLLGTELFKVPTADKERLSKWPNLQMAKGFSVKGESWYKSSVDVVLSNAGWVAVTGRTGSEYRLQAWTPEKRGVYVRDCLLPHAVGLMGRRIKHSIAYDKFRFFLQ